jgi:hypothetical protein
MGEPMDRSGRIFSRPTKSFEEAFPTLENAVLRYEVFDFGTPKGKGIFSLREEGGLMRCRNPRCYRGGYEIDSEVSKMIYENQTEKHIDLSCEGDEGTPKRIRARSCDFSIEGDITLKFKQPKTPSGVESSNSGAPHSTTA